MGLFDKLLGEEKKADQYIGKDGRPAMLDDLINQLSNAKGYVDLHFSYLNIIGQTYYRRHDPKTRDIFKMLSIEHIEKFDAIHGQLKKDLGMLPRVPTFQHLATVYTEEGE